MKYIVMIDQRANPVADQKAMDVAEDFAKNGGTIGVCNECLFHCIRVLILRKVINHNEIEFIYNGEKYYPTNFAKFEDISIFEAFDVVEKCLDEMIDLGCQ